MFERKSLELRKAQIAQKYGKEGGLMDASGIFFPAFIGSVG
jgi:hypothetical protein